MVGFQKKSNVQKKCKNALNDHLLLSWVKHHLIMLKFITTRLLGRFAPILYLNFEHVHFVYILKQRRKKFSGFKKKLADLRFLKILQK